MYVVGKFFSVLFHHTHKKSLYLLLTYKFLFTRSSSEAYSQHKAELCSHSALKHIRLILPKTNIGQKGDNV